jgi:hypothetical protein
VEAADPLEELGVNSTERDRLRRALGAVDEADLTLRVRALQMIATKEFVDWLLGRHRYFTVAESDAARVLRIFRDIRKESPTRSALANEFGFSPGRATSIAARLRYGEGQSFEPFRYEAARRAITSMLPKPSKDADELQALYLTPEVAEIVMEVAAAIMLDSTRRAQGGEWAEAVMPKEQRMPGLAIVTASSLMWSFIMEELARRANTADAT